MWTFLESSEFWKRRRLRLLSYCWDFYFLFIALRACSDPSPFSASLTILQISMFYSISSFSSSSLVASSILNEYKSYYVSAIIIVLTLIPTGVSRGSSIRPRASPAASTRLCIFKTATLRRPLMWRISNLNVFNVLLLKLAVSFLLQRNHFISSHHENNPRELHFQVWIIWHLS